MSLCSSRGEIGRGGDLKGDLGEAGFLEGEATGVTNWSFGGGVEGVSGAFGVTGMTGVFACDLCGDCTGVVKANSVIVLGVGRAAELDTGVSAAGR